MHYFLGTHLIDQDPVTIEGHQVGLHHLSDQKTILKLEPGWKDYIYYIYKINELKSFYKSKNPPTF